MNFIDDTSPAVRTPEINSTIRDDIILLIDSNEKYINTDQFSSNKQTRLMFCPAIPSVIKTLTESTLGQPSHITIHVGTNDIELASPNSCLPNFQNLIQIASQKYLTSKILISSLLKRADDIDIYRSEFNAKLGSLCTPFPNDHLVNNDNIPADFLPDNKHLKRRKIGALVANLKDVIFNRSRPETRPARQTFGPPNTPLPT